MEDILYLGLDAHALLPKRRFLSIVEEAEEIPDHRNPRTFDPAKHSYNFFAKMDYLKRCAIVDTFDALFSGRGDTTLTKDEGLELIAEWLEDTPPSLDKLVQSLPKGEKPTPGYLWAKRKVARMLRSPVLRRVFCDTPNFTLNKNCATQVVLNRRKLGSFDCRVLAMFFMAEYDGQLVVRNAGQYLKDSHVRYAEEGRLICDAFTLKELPESVRDHMLLHKTVASRVTATDARTLAEYQCPFPPETTEYKGYIKEVMGLA